MPICLGASSSFPPALTCLSALPLARSTFAPHPDAPLGRQVSRGFSNILYKFIYWEAAGQIKETTAKICAADDAQGWNSSESPVEALVINSNHHHRSLSLLRTSIAVWGHSPSLFYLLSSSISPIPITMCWNLPPPVGFSYSPQQWLQMRFCRWSHIGAHPIILPRPQPGAIWSLAPFSLSANPVLRSCK